MKRAGKILPKRRSVSPNETFNKGVKLTSQNYCINCNIPIQNGYKYCGNKCEQEYKRNLIEKNIQKNIQKKNYQSLSDNIL